MLTTFVQKRLMTRILRHYIRRATVLQILADGGLLLLGMLVVLAWQLDTLRDVKPMAGARVLTLAAGMVVIGTASGIYQQPSHLSLVQSCARAGLVLLLALPLTYLVFNLFPGDFLHLASTQLAAVFGVALVVTRRVYLTHWSPAPRARTRVLVFGAGPAAQVVGHTLRSSDPNVEIVGFLPGPNEKELAVPLAEVLRPAATLLQTASALEVDEIVVALTERRSGSMPLRQLLDCKLSSINVYDLATHFEKRLGQIRVDFVNAGWLIFGDGFNQGALRTAVKRVFDLVFSVALIIFSTPTMLLTALAIKLDSRGPVFYRQERVGLNGSVFMVTKFRSMGTDAEKDGQPRWAAARDARVTRVGGIIRRLRIDELPQLFNVLLGQMSLVGPRPERPYFVEKLTQQIPYYAVRHSVKPGVTGWAQVRFQYGSTVEDSQEKLQYDLFYVKNHSLFLDLVVLFDTVGVVLTGKGAR